MASNLIGQHRTSGFYNFNNVINPKLAGGQLLSPTVLTPSSIDTALTALIRDLQACTKFGSASYDFEFIDGVLQWVKLNDVVCMRWYGYYSGNLASPLVRKVNPIMAFVKTSPNVALYGRSIEWGYFPKVFTWINSPI